MASRVVHIAVVAMNQESTAAMSIMPHWLQYRDLRTLLAMVIIPALDVPFAARDGPDILHILHLWIVQAGTKAAVPCAQENAANRIMAGLLIVNDHTVKIVNCAAIAVAELFAFVMCVPSVFSMVNVAAF